MKHHVILPVLAVTLLAAGISEAAPRYPWPNERVETTETYKFTGGTLAGDTIVIEKRYEIYDLLDDEGAEISDDPPFYSWQGGCPPVEVSVAFAGVRPTGQYCSFSKSSPEAGMEAHLFFNYDPAENPYGIASVFEWAGYVGFNFAHGTGEMCQFGYDDEICTVTYEQRITLIPDPIPLPAPALLLIGALGSLGLVRRRGIARA